MEFKVPDDKKEALRTAYQEVCRSYHAIADFRAKLLGLLPLASGTGIYLLAKGDTNYLVPLGIFGFVVTLGLFVYEIRVGSYTLSLEVPYTLAGAHGVGGAER